MAKLIVSILFLLLFVTSYALADTPETIIGFTGQTIDLTTTVTPREYGTNESHHFILNAAAALYRYNYTWGYEAIQWATSGILFIGAVDNDVLHRTDFIVRSGTTQIKQFSTTGSNIKTININDYTPLTYQMSFVGDIEIDKERNQFYVIDNTAKKVNVYDYNFLTPSGHLDISFSYQFDIDIYGTGSIIFSTFYDDNLFLHDVYNNTIYRFDRLGELIETFYYVETGYSYDLFFYNNTLFLIDYTNKQADATNTQLSPQPILYDGIRYLPQSCEGNDINSENPTYTGRLCENLTAIITEAGQLHFACDEISDVCVNGCEQTINGTTSSGNCQPQSCTNECFTLNENTCTTVNTYSQCIQGQDGCYDLVGSFYCPINQYCSEGQCGSATSNQTGLWTQEGMVVNADIQSTNAYELTENTAQIATSIITTPVSTLLSPTLGLITQYILKSLYQSVATQVRMETISNVANEYRAISCDFTNNIIEADYLTHNDLNKYHWTTSVDITNNNGLYYLDINDTTIKQVPTTSLSEEIEIMFEPLNTQTVTLNFKKDTAAIASLNITYNKTAKNIRITDNVYNKILLNDTSLQPTDDLQRIVLVGRFIKDINSAHYEILVIRKPSDDEVITRTFTLPIQYTTSVNKAPNIIEFNKTTNETFRVYQIISKEQDGFEAFTQNTNVTPKTCTYEFTGCKNIRVWGNNQQFTPTYHFYEDVQVCAAQLGTNVNQDIVQEAEDKDMLEKIVGRNFSQNQKILIAILTIGLVFTIFVSSYIETRQKSILVFGSAISVMLMIFFALPSIGYLPAWIVVLSIIIAALVIAKIVTDN